MNIPPLLRSPLFCLVLCLAFGSELRAELCRVLVLSPSSASTGFPAADISLQLKSLLEGSGRYAEVDVTYRDITRDAAYATSLLGVAYVPPYRTDHISAIQQGGWTHVVMIDRPFCYAVAPELHYEGVNAVAKIISAAGAQPVLMMPWVDRATIDGYATSNSLVREYAYRVGDGVRDSLGRSVPVVPAGVAWSTLDAASRGTVPAQPTMGVALNTNAKYSAAASLFCYLTGQNAKSVPYVPAGLSAGTRDAIADQAAAVAASEAGSVRYTGAFQSARVRFWGAPATLAYSAEGTSTENAIADQLKKISADDGTAFVDTNGIFVTNLTAGKTAAKLVFGRDSILSAVSAYDNGSPVTTMVAGFDRQADAVSTGPAAAIEAEWRSINLYKSATFGGWDFLPYHLLWVRTMYDLNIPIDSFSVHAPDWQFAATASALYTMRMGGRNGIYPAKVGYVYWSPALRTERFAWQAGQMAWRTMHEMATLQPAPAAPDRPYGLDRVIDAEYPHDASRSLTPAVHAVETFQLNGLGEGDWTSYQVDFGNSAPSAISCLAQVATAGSGAGIEVRDGSASGPLLGTLSLPSTGGVDTFQEARGVLTPGGAGGVRELFFVFRVPAGGEVRFDAFRLSSLARANESVWTNPSGGAWESAANWKAELPGGNGWTARFSLDIPGGLAEGTQVGVSGPHVLTKLELGHGVGTAGGIRLYDNGGGTLEFQSSSGAALIRKIAGGDDVISVPLNGQAPMQIRNETDSWLSLTEPVTGQNDLLPCGNMNFSGSGYDLGRLGFGTGLTYPGNVNTAHLGGDFFWTAHGTVRNFYIPQHTTWTLDGGSMTNLGWTEIGNEDGGGSGGKSILNLNGGTFRHASSQYLRLGQFYKATTTINLNGGIFETQTAITKGPGAVTFTWNGGLFRYSGSTDVADLFASGANPDVIAKVGPGGMWFEVVAGRSVTMQNDVSPVGAVDGGLRKTGAGVLVLAGANTCTGPVVVEQGVLRATAWNSLGNPKRFTVNAGATLSVPGSGGISLYGPDAVWTGAGTVEGGLMASGARIDLTQGPLVVTDYATFGALTIAFVPQPGATVIQAGGDLFLYGVLTLDIQAPAQAIPAGGTLTLVAGATREGEFDSVSGSGLWAASYVGASVVLTAQANIPGVVLAAPNNGAPATWGSSLVLTASASDVVGISKVEFYANGRLVGQGVEGPAGVYSFSWDLGTEEAQTFVVTSRVTNLDGVTLESPGQNLVVAGLAGADATWTNPAGGTWSTTANWLGGNVADAYGVARFDAIDLPAGTTTVDVDAPRTLAKLHFGDLGTGTAGGWKLAGSGSNKIHLSGGSAEVNVAAGASAELAVPVVATVGFAKSGSGNLTLSVPNSGLAGKTQVSAGSLAIADPGALGASTLTLAGGALSFPAALTLSSAMNIDTAVATKAAVSAPVTFTGPWTQASTVNGTALLLEAGASTANITLSNSIQLPGVDLQVAGYNSAVEFTGNVSVRNLTFYGRSSPSNMALTVTFSGNAVATCSGKLATLNNSGTTNIRITNDARLTIPDHAATQRSSFYLWGGVLTARRLTVGSLSSLYFSGGTLRPMASDAQFVASAAGSTRAIFVQANGMVVDTNGCDVGVGPAVTTGSNPDGGIAKKGLGTLTLNGPSASMTWRGPTHVQAGTLQFGSLSGFSVNTRVVNIAAGASLDIGSSLTPALSLSSTAHFLSGGGTLKGGLSMPSGTLTVAAGAPLTVTGSAALGGKLVVTGTLAAPGDYVVLNAASVTGTFAADPTLPAAPAGFSRQLVYESNRVLLRVSGPGETWLAAHAGAGARFSHDPDGNGWTLLQEYALGGLPGEGTGVRQTAGLSADGKPQIHFAYNTAAVDARIEVQVSHDLTTWTTLLSKPVGSNTSWTQHVAGAAIQGGSESGGVQQVEVTAPPTAETNTFFRTRVLRAE